MVARFRSDENKLSLFEKDACLILKASKNPIYDRISASMRVLLCA